ncbi:MAG: hypothetical protein ACTHN5_01775 [Phycisphaerae bacterium]
MNKRIAVAILCALFPAGAAFASLQADGTILPISSPTDTSFQYDITLHNTGTTNVGSFWFAWVPGLDFLPSQPLNVQSPAGWTANIINDPYSYYGDGYSIQWIANTPLPAGQSLPGFSFTSADTPATMAGYSPIYFGYYPTTTSYAYAGTPELTEATSFTLNVLPTITATPEPATASLTACAAARLLLKRRRQS